VGVQKSVGSSPDYNRLNDLIRSWLSCLLLAALTASSAFAASPLDLDLPSLDALTDYRPKIPLRVYTSDGVLIGEYGERREFVAIKDVPLVQKQALLAIEDARFYEHGGVDYRGVARALIADLTGGLKQGASTITMQVARDFYLTKEKLFSRKFTEVMLAYKIERTLSKDQILELYMNQVYLGQRAYGFSSAARVYFGKPLKELSLAQAAMLAGLPQSPSLVNPVINPKRAQARQHLVLKRMHDLGYITEAQLIKAQAEDLHVRMDGQIFSNHASYVAELVRQTMAAQYNDEAYTRGLNVFTTLISTEQDAAYEAVHHAVLEFDRRHAYRGPEGFVALPGNLIARRKAIESALQQHPAVDHMQAAVILSVTPRRLRATLANDKEVDLVDDKLRGATEALAPKASPELRLKVGSIIRLEHDGKGQWNLAQMPNVGCAYLSLNNQTGAYRALVGGFDFNTSQLNHVTQAWRQPGSAIKPFIYSASLEKGYSPATQVDDDPLTLTSAETGGQPWSPRNDDDVYDGPVTLRRALAQSKNVASVRLLRAITVLYAHDFLQRFGIDSSKQPLNYTLALGTGVVTPLQMAGAYSVFANGGYRISPHFIQKVVDTRGNVLFEAKPEAVAKESDRVLDARNAFVMTSMLHEVTVSGTAAAAQRLGRTDLAGKTGTSSDAMDAWFAGSSGDNTAVAWMGYDDPQSLGGREFGATLALPIWMDVMRVELKGKPQLTKLPPAGLSRVDGDWMYDEFQNQTAVRTIDLDSLPPPKDPLVEPVSK
jgi:penicillin-binding protein 1A